MTTPSVLPPDVIRARQEVTKTKSFSNATGVLSTTSSGQMTDRINESNDDLKEKNSSTEIATDQSLSLDLTQFAKDL